MNPLLLPPRLMLRALEDLHTLALAAARLERIEERLNERAEAIIVRGDRVIEMGERLDARTEAILAQGERIEAAAREVADRGAELTAALPVMQRAIEMAEPLEGVVERLGRVADRLPGGARGRATGR